MKKLGGGDQAQSTPHLQVQSLLCYQDLSILSSSLTDKVPVTFNLLGLVSGATIIMPCSDAVRCAPALVMKFCSVHVRPEITHFLI